MQKFKTAEEARNRKIPVLQNPDRLNRIILFMKRSALMLRKNQNTVRTFPDTAQIIPNTTRKETQKLQMPQDTQSGIQGTARMHLKIFPGMIKTRYRHMIPFPSCTFIPSCALSPICRAASKHSRTRLTPRK